MTPRVLSLLLVAALGLAGCSSGSGGGSTPSQKQADKAAQKDPLYALTLMQQGSVLLQQERFDDALARFAEADRIAPGNATVQNMIGLCHLRLDQFDRALASFNTALELIPSYSDARNNRGAAYLALGQFRLAEVDFIAVLGDSTYPHRYEVYYNLGMTYLERGQVGAAEENFRKAVAAQAPVYDAYLRLAEIAEDRGELAAALAILEDARLRFPDRIETSFQLGRVLLQLDRSGEASKYLNEVINAAPGSALATQAAALIGPS